MKRLIKNLFALTIITEIGDIQRFTHPRQLVSWIGLDVREYSSGGRHNRMGITKQGNRYLRTALIEANQRRLSRHGGLRGAQEAKALLGNFEIAGTQLRLRIVIVRVAHKKRLETNVCRRNPDNPKEVEC